MKILLVIFLSLRFLQHLAERFLSSLNRQYYSDQSRQAEAQRILGIVPEDMTKTLAYTGDKFTFGRLESWISILVTLVFIGAGGLGWLEQWAIQQSGSVDSITTGLLFFSALIVLSSLFQLPFDWYRTFSLEEKHGFNRQTKKIFIIDRLKGLLIFAILALPLLGLLLQIMTVSGSAWWIYAWFVMSGFSILTAWLYPTFLAPLFNKFSPLEEGELKESILKLAAKVNFNAAGLSVMDASRRSSHGNAYFTGVFGKKKIVLFDTLVESLSHRQIVAVLAHELGHFKLNHVRWGILRSLAMTGLTFYLLGLCLPLEDFYLAFGLSGITNHGALLVFSIWFGLIGFFINPLESYLSRRNEFAADRFAVENVGGAEDLGQALLKLREKSHAMPITHPWFSMFYYSHPPMIERLSAMGYQQSSQ